MKTMHGAVRVYPEDLEQALPLSDIFSEALKHALHDPRIAARARSIKMGRGTVVTSIRMTASQYYYMRSAGLYAASVIQVGLQLVNRTWDPCA